MKTRIRCLLSDTAPGLAALCQLGLALRNDVAGAWLVRRLAAAGAAGESLTYGNSVGSSLFATWS